MQLSDPIFFTHGNGFPNITYRVLFDSLKPCYDIECIDMLGHNQRYPVTDNWHYLVNELVEAVQSLNRSPVIGLGHSFGGVLTLLASIQNPELFKCVIMLDSPILSPFKSFMLKIIKQLGLIDWVTPARKAKKRRILWETPEEAFDYFRKKRLFQYVQDECLKDYVQYGLTEIPGGYTLKFDPVIEYQIFRTLPDHLPDVIQATAVPTGLIYGHNTNVVTRADLKFMHQNYHICCREIEGTHMFPLEAPTKTSQAIKDMIEDLIGS